MLYPLIFQPIYKRMIWGGERIAKNLDRGKLSGKVGESWEVTCRAEEMGIAANGVYSGKKFCDLINSDREKYLGKKLYKNDNFPLLVKIIDANENLSVQVHPTDEYASENENGSLGKTEIWYVIEAPQDGELIVGLKQGISREQFKQAIENGDVESCLNRMPVEAGDVVYIPAGLTHALTKGSMVLEIQQNSDITYRVYDYGRLGEDGNPRRLHIEKALDVLDFAGANQNNPLQGVRTEEENCTKTHYITEKYFSMSKYDISDICYESTDYDRFLIFSCVRGDCEIRSENYCMDIKKGESVFIPAALGKFSLMGDCSLIKSYVP